MDKQTDQEPSKKAAKKAAAAAAKEEKRLQREAELQAQRAASENIINYVVKNVDEDIYGNLPLICNAVGSVPQPRQWVEIRDITPQMDFEKSVWIRARVNEVRCKSKTLAFLVLRWQGETIQGVMSAATDAEKEAVKFVSALSLESVVDVYASFTAPPQPIQSTTVQNVELKVLKCFCVSKAEPKLPFQLKDANKRDDEEGVEVYQDTRLDNRVLDLRTNAMYAVMRISSEVCTLFREFLLSQRFVEIHTPKLIGGASEGGANVFKLQYFDRPACLAQSPQFYKQMSISADMDRVFEIGPVFRAENSNTHRHLCEFVGLDMEMGFKDHYDEVLQMIEEMFCHIFEGLETRCQREIEAVYRQWPSEPFKWRPRDSAARKILRFEFSEGCRMLREAGYSEIPEDISEFDIGTEQEKALGKLVKAKYDTDVYYMTNYPLAVRPFYTMPHPENSKLSNSYDIFMRGEEIVSGAQRVHDPVLLEERIRAKGVDVATVRDYIDSFKLGSFPHGGCGVGLERVVMLFLGLNNIRKVSMFPRDPKRLTP